MPQGAALTSKKLKLNLKKKKNYFKVLAQEWREKRKLRQEIPTLLAEEDPEQGDVKKLGHDYWVSFE